MTREELDALWRDPRNYRGGVYFCKADPRVIVPRRIKWMGWTVNFARPGAIPVLLLFIAGLVLPISVVSALQVATWGKLLTGAVAVLVLCLVCAHMSSRTG
jgi:hypothetical protein